MTFTVEYKYRGMLEIVELNNCRNILDALYKFYQSHGFGFDIISIKAKEN